MLHAALIGLPSTGKSTLFQLMTSAKEGGRSAKGDSAVGISKVPDARLDRLTAMFNPKKRVPATIEFTDSLGPARAAATALVDVAAVMSSIATGCANLLRTALQIISLYRKLLLSHHGI